MKRILFILLSFPLCANQPFEPIFQTGGVAPLLSEPGHPSLVQLRSGEQFVRLVGKATVPAVVKIDKAVRVAAAEQTAVFAQVAAQWPTPLRCCTVDAATQAKLASAIVGSIGQKQIVLPSYVVFYQGKGVTPMLHGLQTADSLQAAIAQRLAYVQQRDAGGWGAAIAAWCGEKYTHIASFLRGMWTTLVGSFFA